MLEILLTYFFVAFLFIIIFYILGGIVFNILKLSINLPFVKVFSFLLCGILVSVLIYSIYSTHFNSINIGLLIPLGFLLSFITIKDKKRERLLKTLAVNSKIILLSITILFLASCYNFYFLWDNVQHILVPLEADKVFYARVSDYLNNTGIESSYLDYFNANTPRPYHYFELWLTALIIRIPGLNTLLVQQVTLNSIFFLVFYFGGLSLINILKRITIFDILLCLLLPFFYGINVSFFPHVLLHQDDFYFFENPVWRQKLYGISILLIASVILLLRKRLDLSLMILLISCYFNIS